MTLSLIETAINTVKTYLEANMVAKLDELDIKYGDFELANIEGWYVAEVSAVPEYPSILILGDFTDVISEGGGWLKAEHTVTIVCLATDQETERLRKRLYRYIRAVLEILKAGRSELGYTVVFERLEYSPLFGKEGTFMSDSRLIIKLGKYETE